MKAARLQIKNKEFEEIFIGKNPGFVYLNLPGF
jgi:hypothetical protein